MPSRAVPVLAFAMCVGACTPDEVLSAGSSSATSSGDASSGAASSGDSGPIADTGEDGWSSTSPTSGSSSTGSGVTDGTTGATGSTTSGESTATTTTDGSTTSGDPSSSGDSTSSGVATSSATTSSSSTGDPTTTSDSLGSTGGESSSGGESGSTGGDTDGGGPCEVTVVRTHVGRVTTHHDGDRFVTVDEAGNLVLWDTATLAVLFEARRVGHARISGGTLAYTVLDVGAFEYETVSIVDASTGSPAGEVPYQFAWGVAQDGSYVWTGSATALAVYEPDGTPRWSVDENFLGVQVLAQGEMLHAFAGGQSATEVLHYSADAGVVDSDGFAGTFGGWFEDVPRYWTNQGMAYRVYDVDNTVLVLELGAPTHGWGTRLVRPTGVVDVFDPDTVLAPVGSDRFEDGAAVLWRAIDGSATLVRLDTDPVTVTPVAPGCCITEDYPSFAYADGAWLLGGDDGLVTDDLGRAITDGEAVAIAGSTAGRMALSMGDGVLHVADVGEDCTWDESSSFARTGRNLRMSGDGTTLLSTERYFSMFGSMRDGTRMYALPDGALQAEYQLGLMSDSLLGHDISDDASVWSRLSNNTGIGTYWVTGDVMLGGNGHVVPRVAPDAQHVVISDGGIGVLDTWADSVTYFYDPQDFAGIIDGVAHGFIDDAHVLVARYADCGAYCVTMIGSDVVDMTGTIVAATALPDLRELRRIDDGAAIAFDPAGNGAIYDVMAGVLLWEAPPGAAVEVAGPNHVLISTGARVDVVRWR